jgi:diguanylate cyclase (GGDEF)-like protein
MLDSVSLVLGVAISGLGLSLTMVVLTSRDRKSHFKLIWATGATLFVFHVLTYWFYAHGAPYGVGVLSCALQGVAAAFLYASVRRFMDDRYRPLRSVLLVIVPYLLVVPTVFLAGYDGIALVLQNFVTAGLLIAAGAVYLRNLSEAPVALGTLSALYLLTGLSFALCGVVLLIDGQWSIGYPPQNWAETLNAAVSVLAISGVGALTLSVDQTLLAKLSLQTAMRDPLTELLNRRGIAALLPEPLREGDAVALFDLDYFKQINDRYGHAVGDRVICAFADTLREQGRTTDAKVRHGGEEFALVMARVSPAQALSIARRVGEAFSLLEMVSDEGEQFRCTVSAGVAFGGRGGSPIDEVITRADQALYSAKRAGRNRVEIFPGADPVGLRLVG